jgi:hypothetical protein
VQVAAGRMEEMRLLGRINNELYALILFIALTAPAHRRINRCYVMNVIYNISDRF